MAQWSKNKVLPENINGNQEFTRDSNFTVAELNAIVNNSFYASDMVESMGSQPNVQNVNNVGVPNVSIETFTENGEIKKRFKFENLKGATGEQGQRGEQGIQGERGEKGEKGDTGETGATGARGEQGEKGEKGDTGADGRSATHSWNGTVLTIVSASGVSSADLKGEQGEQGIQGIQGEKGEDGSKWYVVNDSFFGIQENIGDINVSNSTIEANVLRVGDYILSSPTGLYGEVLDASGYPFGITCRILGTLKGEQGKVGATFTYDENTKTLTINTEV